MLAQTKVEECRCCSSTNIVKNGFTRHKNQSVLCRDCGKSPVLKRKKALNCEFAQLRRSFLERLSLSGVSRVFFISYYQVFQALNLVCLLLPDFKRQVSTCPAGRPVLQFDELCSFCGRKKDKQWLWAALCQSSRQIVAYVIGDRSELTFRSLLRKIPLEYLRCDSYSHYWKSYRILHPAQQGQPPASGQGKRENQSH